MEILVRLLQQSDIADALYRILWAISRQAGVLVEVVK